MMSNEETMSFKSSINAICVWWAVTIGLCVLLYLVHSLISYVLLLWQHYCNRQHRVATIDREDYHDFDEVITAIKGKEGFSNLEN